MAVRGHQRIGMRSAEPAGKDLGIGFEPEPVVDDPADGAHHRIVPGEEQRYPFAKIEGVRRLAANPRLRHVADRNVKLSEARTGERGLYQARLARLALVVRSCGIGSGLDIRHAQPIAAVRSPTSGWRLLSQGPV